MGQGPVGGLQDFGDLAGALRILDSVAVTAGDHRAGTAEHRKRLGVVDTAVQGRPEITHGLYVSSGAPDGSKRHVVDMLSAHLTDLASTERARRHTPRRCASGVRDG